MDQTKKIVAYNKESSEKWKAEADRLAERLVKAESMGADKKAHKFHKQYLEIKRIWNQAMDYFTHFES